MSDYDDIISNATLVFKIEEDCEEPPFDESEFDMFYEDDDFNGPEHKELFRSYWTQVVLSQGFDLELDKPLAVIGGIGPHTREGSPDLFEIAEKLARLAVGMNNCRPVSRKVEFVEVQKLNSAPCSGLSYFITFLAKDCSSGRLMVYQTKIHDLIRGEIKVAIFREKPQKSVLLLKPGERSSSDNSDKATLVFKVKEDCEEIPSNESEFDKFDRDDIFNGPKHKKLCCVHSKGLDRQLDKPLVVMDGIVSSREENPALYATAEKLARVAVGMNNCRPVSKKVEFVELGFVEVKKLNCASCAGFSYSINFLGKDCSSGKLMVYLTKIHDLICEKIEVVIFREKSRKQGSIDQVDQERSSWSFEKDCCKLASAGLPL